MSPPDAPPPPGEGGGEQSDLLDGGVVVDGTARLRRRGAAVLEVASPVARFVAGRERVLGRRVTVPLEDPERAAAELAEAIGEPGARAWLRRALAELAPRGAA